MAKKDNWSDTVKTQWQPRKDIFLEKNPNTIVNYLIKNSDSLGQASKRLNFYINRAGDDMKNKTVLNKAKQILHSKVEKQQKNEDIQSSILNAIQRGLYEGLSKYDLTVLDDDDDDSIMVKNNNYKQQSIYDDLIEKLPEFLDDNKMFKNIVNKIISSNKQYVADGDELIQIIIKAVQIFKNKCNLNWIDLTNITITDLLRNKLAFKYIVKYYYMLNNKQYIAKNKTELKEIINLTINIFKNECDLNWINTSKITDMSDIFATTEGSSFNGHIEKWDVSNVKNMHGMFYENEIFNGHIENWDVSNVQNMSYMFGGATSFNQNISSWNVSNVKNMEGLFYHAKKFNQPIGNWDVSNVKYMSCMFYSANSFNQDISNWNMSNVKNIEGMFWWAMSFNQPIGNWDMSNTTKMWCMFSYAQSFNQDISNWDVSNVTDMCHMFDNATKFNQDISNWDVSNVEGKAGAFCECPIKEEYKPKFK